MNFLETMFYRLIEEPEPQTPEYRENRSVRIDLLGRIHRAMGEEIADKINDIYAERETMENYRYFLFGIQLGLELLVLTEKDL